MPQYLIAIGARFILFSLLFRKKQIIRLFTVLLVSFIFSATASAQVFDSGPSNSKLFAFVINLVGDGVSGDGSGTQINVGPEGALGDSFEADFGTEVNILGGSVGDNFQASAGSEVNIIGGSVGVDFSLNRDRVVCILPCPAFVNISGGTVGDRFHVFENSVVNLFGSEFALDGVPLNDLVLGEAFTIIDRDVTLSGLLEDGSAFSFDLNSDFDASEDTFESGAILTVTFTTQVLLGDVNQDGVVNFLDISSFVSVLSTGDFQAEADTNEDGVVNFLDISQFIVFLSISS